MSDASFTPCKLSLIFLFSPPLNQFQSIKLDLQPRTKRKECQPLLKRDLQTLLMSNLIIDNKLKLLFITPFTLTLVNSRYCKRVDA
jgi:hypothetical protein